MSFARIRKFRRTLAFRLTLWYGFVFSVSTVIAFILFYLLITAVIRQRTDLELKKQIGQFSSVIRLQGIEAVKQMAVLEAQAAGEKKVFFRLLYPDGRAFSSSNIDEWRDIRVQGEALGQLLSGEEPVLTTVRLPERRHQVRIAYGLISSRVILQVGQSLENDTRLLEDFRKIFMVTMAVLILLAVFGGWFMARRALAGVEAVSRTAESISGGDMSRRVPVEEHGEEIDRLALTFNHMLDRIQMLLENIQEMSDNIAHDLKSPLTRIRGVAEIALTQDRSSEAYEQMAASTIEECDRLLDMINTMLAISRTETGVERPEREPTDLARIVIEACELFTPAAEENEIVLDCRAVPGQYCICDVPMIQRMIANLLDNAIKYSQPGGRIIVSILSREDLLDIVISDSGPGISPEDLPYIFDRFYRCDASRSKPGSGLGLSLARAIAAAHEGDIRVESRPEVGSTFTASISCPPETTTLTDTQQ